MAAKFSYGSTGKLIKIADSKNLIECTWTNIRDQEIIGQNNLEMEL